MTTAHNRVAVLHGVNFDILDRRDPAIYGGLSLSELETRIQGWAPRAGAGTDLLPDQLRGRVRRVPAPPARAGRRGADQRRRLDPLQPRDRRRARRRRPARGRGPPLRRRVPRGLAQGLGLRRPGPGEDLRQGPGRLPRGARAARPRARRGRGLMRGRGDRLAGLLAERELDRMLVTDLVNVRYLTGFGGTNGACVCGDGRPPLPHRLPLHRARRRRGRGLGGASRSRATGLAAIAEHLAGRVGFEDDHISVRTLERLRGETRRGGRAGRRRRHGREAAPGQGRRGAGRDRRRLGAGRRGLALEPGARPRRPHRARGRPRRRGADPRARRRPLLPGDRRRRPQRRPAARRAGRARDRPRRAGRLRHGREARRLLLRRHPHLRHRRARRGGPRRLRGRARGPGGGARGGRRRRRRRGARRASPAR